MKRANVILLLTVLALTTGVGCKKNPKALTDIPGSTPTVADTGTASAPQLPYNPQATPGGAFNGLNPNASGLNGNPEGTSLEQVRPPEGTPEDREALAQQTVYFEFDRATIKASERTKLDAVANHLRSNPDVTLKIEGHCDERGTEEYNRALGERRALSAMNYLATSAGIDSTRMTTVSFGEDKPASTGTDESAYSQNRRAEFVLLQAGR